MCNYCPKLEKLKLQTANCKLYLANWQNCILQTDKGSIHPPRHWQTRLYRYTATFEDLLVFDNNFEHVCREFNFCLSCRFAQIAFSSVQSQKLTELASLNSRSWRMATLERTLNSRKWQIPRKEANPWTCIAVLEREWNWGDLAHWPCNAGRWIHCVHECPQLVTRRNLTFATTQMIFFLCKWHQQATLNSFDAGQGFASYGISCENDALVSRSYWVGWV